MNPNNRITYRFDHKGKQVQQDEKVELSKTEKTQKLTAINNVVPLYSTNSTNVINEIHPWDNSLQEELSALEQLIRESGQRKLEEESQSFTQKRATKKPIGHNIPVHSADQKDEWKEEWKEEPFYVDKPNYSTIKGYDREDLNYEKENITRRSNGPSWFNVFLSVAGALATGALFGYLILSLFTGGDMWTGGSNTSKASVSNPVIDNKSESLNLDGIVSLPRSNDESNLGEETVPGADGASTPVSSISFGGESYAYTLLQYGVFSHTAGRDEAIKQLTDKGLPSGSTQAGDVYPVYAGIATDSTEAAALIAVLPEFEVYKKDINVQLPDKLLFKGSKEDASRYFKETNALIATWTTLIAAQLEQPSLSPLGETASSVWQKTFKQWKESSAAMQEGTVDEKGKSYLEKLNKSIESAASSILEYDEKTNKSTLWSTQTELMIAVLSQKEWFDSMGAL